MLYNTQPIRLNIFLLVPAGSFLEMWSPCWSFPLPSPLLSLREQIWRKEVIEWEGIQVWYYILSLQGCSRTIPHCQTAFVHQHLYTWEHFFTLMSFFFTTFSVGTPLFKGGGCKTWVIIYPPGLTSYKNIVLSNPPHPILSCESLFCKITVLLL